MNPVEQLKNQIVPFLCSSNEEFIESLFTAPLYRVLATSEDIDTAPVLLRGENLDFAIKYFNDMYGANPIFCLFSDSPGKDIERDKTIRQIRGAVSIFNGLEDYGSGCPLIFGRICDYRKEITGYRNIGCTLGLRYGISKGRYFIPEVERLNDPYFRSPMLRPEVLISRFCDYAEVYNALEDAASKKVYIGAILAQLSGDGGFIPVSNYYQYHHPLVMAEIGDVVYEGGCGDGETTRGFSRTVGDSGYVYAFDPLLNDGSGACDKCRDLLNVRFEPFGLWSHKEKGWFFINGAESSVVSDASANAVECNLVDLDSYTESIAGRCDMVKLDIEGGEPEAIQGMLRTITKYKPKLAISIYHAPGEQLVDLPLMILRLNLGYRFYIGHHDITMSETVMYAVVE